MDNGIIKYEVAGQMIELQPVTVKNYLARGNSTLTDQEIMLFINLCQYHKLNPWIGEAYPIKFGSEFQMVIGYGTYLRRGEEHPEYKGRKSGIVVLSNGNIVKREGTCLYPSEILVGGWCKVFRLRKNDTDESYAEVSLAEYQKMKDGKPSSNWGSKPATMIRKVAVSQAMRDAFPTQFEGMYTEYEMPQGQDSGQPRGEEERFDTNGAEPITKEQRQAMIGRAQEIFGGKKGNGVLLKIITDMGYNSTMTMTKSIYATVMQKLEELGEGYQPFPDEQTPIVGQGQILDRETGEVMEAQA